MDNTERKLNKQNFLWMPLLLITLANFLYILLVIFGMFMVISEGEDFSKPVFFIANSLIVEGFGLPVILVSDAIAIGIGLLSALFIRKSFSRLWKRRLVFFLVSFYILIFGSLTFLMVKY